MMLREPKKPCSICGRVSVALGLCQRHYTADYRKRSAPRLGQQRRAYARNYYLKNKNTRDKFVRAWREKNRDRVRAWFDSYQASLKVRYKRLHLDAKRRRVTIQLTFEEFSLLVSTDCCFYCLGGLPKKGSALDRIENCKEIGYRATNVVPCCASCNRIRGDNLSFEEMSKLSPFLRAKREGRLHEIQILDKSG